MHILIVDDDVELSGLLRFALHTAGYDISTAFDGEQALARLRERAPDLVILDVNLPLLDGFEVLDRLRRGGSRVPVMLLTVRTTEEDEIRGLDLGADDFLRKPFSPRTLLARVRSLLRRNEAEEDEVLTLGPLALDVERNEASIAGQPPFSLSPLELRLLRAILNGRGKPIEAERLIELVWSDRDAADRESLKQVVHRLRRKLAAAGGSAAWIEYVPNVGYAFARDDAAG